MSKTKDYLIDKLNKMPIKTYVGKIYDIENSARNFICNELDKNNLIRLIQEGDFESDEFNELPIQNFVNKYEENDRYRIVELYKDSEGYFARGVLDEDNDYHFNLFEDVDTYTIAEIADLIKQKQ